MASLIRWSASPARDLLGIRDEVDRVFDNLFTARGVPGDWAGPLGVPVDIEETKEEFVVRADMPGVNQKDVKVSLLGDVLTIRGQRVQETKDRNLHRVERRYGSFERSFSLGLPVRADQVKASYHDGVLEIRIPKAEEAKVREIEVQVASA